MKCHYCVLEGKRSTLRSHGGSSTLMTPQRYWDEDGLLHVHDRNKTTTTYECSNGHLYNEKTSQGCPVDTCDHAAMEVERKKLKPKEALAQFRGGTA
jgi:hypothetical protein